MNFVAIWDTEGSSSAIVLSALLTLWWFWSFSLASLALFAVTLSGTGKVWFKSVLAHLSVGSHGSAPADWCLMPALCATSASNSGKGRRHPASFRDVSWRFKIQGSALWSVRNLNQEPSRYGLSSKPGQNHCRTFLVRGVVGVLQVDERYRPKTIRILWSFFLFL